MPILGRVMSLRPRVAAVLRPRDSEAERLATSAAETTGAVSTRTVRARVAVAAVLLASLGFYAWIAWADGNPFPLHTKQYDFQNQLSNAFLDGRLSVADAPAELLALPDPYDPVANEAIRAAGFHDFSLSNGKLYLYWGPAPALVAFIPYRALGLGDLTPTAGTLGFCFLALVWATLLLRFVVRRFLPETPLWMQLVAIGALALSSGAPFIIREGRGYEVSIAAGACFLMGGLFFLVSGTLGPRLQLWRIAVGSALLGVGVAARPTIVLAAVALVAVWLWIRLAREVRVPGQIVRFAAAFFGPFLVLLLLVGLYNRLRFNSWTEFGTHLQLAGENMRTYDFFQLSNLPDGLYHYFLALPRVTGSFPFFELAPGDYAGFGQGIYWHEPVAGMLAIAPTVGLGLIAVAILWQRLIRRKPALLLVMGVLGVVGVLTSLVTASVFSASTMRYGYDFIPFLLLAGLVAWFSVTEVFPRRGSLLLAVNVVFLVSIVYGCLTNIGIAVSHCLPSVPHGCGA